MRWLISILAAAGSVASLSACDTPALHRGADKSTALHVLQERGVTTLSLDVYPTISVSRASDVRLFHDAEGIILGSGDIRIAFDGDVVTDLFIALRYPEYASVLSGASTREQALAGLRTLLDQDPHLTFRNCSVRNIWVFPGSLSAEDEKLLDRYDAWSGSYENRWGYWHVDVVFQDDRVVDIDRSWAPGPK